MAFTFWKFENREKWKKKWKFVANYFHSLVSRLTLQSEVDVVDRSDRRMHSTILSLLTDPFPLPPHHTAAAHAPVLRCLHVKLNFYTNRERARASCIDPQPPPQAFAPAAEK